MGSSQSKSSGMRRVSSSSAAFGRLRIDSPGATPGSGKVSFRRRKELRAMSEATAGDGGSPLLLPARNDYNELSPLISPSQVPQRLLSHQKAESSMETSIGSPPLQIWIMPALCCALAYALYNIFIKKGSSHINPVMGGVILQLVAAILGSCLLTFLVLKEGGAEVIVYDTEGIQWAILAGVAVGVAEIVSFFVSSLGVQAMQSIPIIIGGYVMFGTFLGAVALHEELSIRGWLGVVMIAGGISLVGLDSEGEE